MSWEEAIDKIKQNSRRYAKRQLTWFKKDKDTVWFDPKDKKQIIDYIQSSS
ncbi:tRNA dimethylallyltransferase [compost metagenome]